jgi:hypothetical protein
MKTKCESKTVSDVSLEDPGANLGRRGGKPATNRFSYGAAYPCIYSTQLLRIGHKCVLYLETARSEKNIGSMETEERDTQETLA